MRLLVVSFLLMIFVSGLGRSAYCQTGSNSVYGDVKVDESKAGGVTRLSYDVILYNLARQVVARQTVTSTGRYRFNNLNSGVYDLAVESENVEVARIRVELVSPMATDLRQDINLELKASGGPASTKP